jgi:O-antigen ligase
LLGFVVSLGGIVGFFYPSLIPSGDFKSDAWHGLLGYKNEWAGIVVLAASAVLCLSRRTIRGSILIAALTLIAFGLVAATQSMGGIVVLFAILLFSKSVAALRWRWQSLVTAALAGAVIVLPASLLIARNFDEVTAFAGRDPSLTGRTDLWRLSLASIERSPILGYGYSAFWDVDSPAAIKIRDEVNWDAPHSHNGFIDLTLGLGLAGLFLLASSFLVATRRAVEYFWRGAGQEAIWPLVFLSFFFLHQLTEGTVVTGNSIFWILYVAVCCSVTNVPVGGNAALESRDRRQPAVRMYPCSLEHS